MTCGKMTCGEMTCGEMTCGEMTCGEMTCGEMTCGETTCGKMTCGGWIETLGAPAVRTALPRREMRGRAGAARGARFNRGA